MYRKVNKFAFFVLHGDLGALGNYFPTQARMHVYF